MPSLWVLGFKLGVHSQVCKVIVAEQIPSSQTVLDFSLSRVKSILYSTDLNRLGFWKNTPDARLRGKSEATSYKQQ